MSLSIAQLFDQIVQSYPDQPAQLIKDDAGAFHPRSWQELRVEVDACATALLEAGAGPDSRIGLISENRAEWFVADLATLSIGAADVPRGIDATDEEIVFILSTVEATICFAETETVVSRLLALAPRIPSLNRIVVFSGSGGPSTGPGPVVESFASFTERGRIAAASAPDRIATLRAAITDDTLATIIFTSGTTGEPKGVMLSHRNFMHQVEHVPDLIDVGSEDIWLCVLPVWHSFERIMQYVSLGAGSCLAYSKPIGKIMLADFQKVRPTWMASVPRIWEAIRAGIYRNVKSGSAVKRAMFTFFVGVGSTWARLRDMVRGRVPRFTRRNRLVDVAVAIVPFLLLFPLKALGDLLVFGKIRARLGGRFKAGISGGGALPSAVDAFFSAAGILLLEGYGLTETAPVLGVRDQKHPVPGTVGPVFPGTEIEIRSETGERLPPGTKGIIWARGPQVMLGYFRRPDLTSAIMDEAGFLNTGDLGMLTWDNELKITGRAKDTIVLLGGENVEPTPIEERIRESEYVAQVVVVGQDQKFLGALVLPDFDALGTWAESQGLTERSPAALAANDRVKAFIQGEINALVSTQTGFKAFERIARIALVAAPFEIGEELSAKQEIKRFVIAEKYAAQIASLFV